MAFYKDLKNQKFGKLTALEHITKKNGSYWLCKCDCGNLKEVRANHLVGGTTISCGCIYKQTNQQFKKYNRYEIKGDYTEVYTNNTNSKFLIDTEDLERVKEHCWYEANNGYIVFKDKKVTMLHRFVMNCNDKKLVVDHIHHDIKDNRKSQLRICSQKENTRNRIITQKTKSGETNIYIAKRGNKIYYLVEKFGIYRGCRKTLEEAKTLRDSIKE